MILKGAEIQALLGALLIHEHVPLANAEKAVLSDEDLEAVATARARLRNAKMDLQPQEPRGPENWRLMLLQEAEVAFSGAEVHMLRKVVTASLGGLTADVDLSTQAGPGVGLEALRAAAAKLDGVVE